jgi:hypothetical protein
LNRTTNSEPQTDRERAAYVELVDSLARRVGDLEQQVEDAAQRLAASSSASPAPGEALPPLDWDCLSPSELEAAWSGLVTWLDDQVRAHRVQSMLPKRWWREAALVAHLAAYWRWYVEVVSENPSGHGAAAWHDAFLRFAETVWPGYVSRATTAGSLSADAPELWEWIDNDVQARLER